MKDKRKPHVKGERNAITKGGKAFAIHNGDCIIRLYFLAFVNSFPRYTEAIKSCCADMNLGYNLDGFFDFANAALFLFHPCKSLC